MRLGRRLSLSSRQRRSRDGLFCRLSSTPTPTTQTLGAEASHPDTRDSLSAEHSIANVSSATDTTSASLGSFPNTAAAGTPPSLSTSSLETSSPSSTSLRGASNSAGSGGNEASNAGDVVSVAITAPPSRSLDSPAATPSSASHRWRFGRPSKDSLTPNVEDSRSPAAVDRRDDSPQVSVSADDDDQATATDSDADDSATAADEKDSPPAAAPPVITVAEAPAKTLATGPAGTPPSTSAAPPSPIPSAPRSLLLLPGLIFSHAAAAAAAAASATQAATSASVAATRRSLRLSPFRQQASASKQQAPERSVEEPVDPQIDIASSNTQLYPIVLGSGLPPDYHKLTRFLTNTAAATLGRKSSFAGKHSASQSGAQMNDDYTPGTSQQVEATSGRQASAAREHATPHERRPLVVTVDYGDTLSSVHNESVQNTTEAPLQSVHRVAWSVAAEKGYQTVRTAFGDFARTSIHPNMEDIHWPTLEDRERLQSDPGALEREEKAAIEAVLAHDETAAVTFGTPLLKRRKRSTEMGQLQGSSTVHSVLAVEAKRQSDTDIVTLSEPASDATTLEDEAEQQLAKLRAEFRTSISRVQSLTSCSPMSDSSIPRVFVLADGHGGVRAAKFFVPRIRDLMHELIVSRPWDLDLESDRLLWVERVEALFVTADAEYVALQTEAYKKWKETGAVHSQRPPDDGCTLIATVLIGGWLVNMNVGDSRTVVYSRASAKVAAGSSPSPGDAHTQTTTATREAAEVVLQGEKSGAPTDDGSSLWREQFSSVDHNMSHSGKVWDIHRSGGHFISPPGAARPVQIEPPERRQHRPYLELNGGRVSRQSSEPVRAVGVSHRRTLNLTATMGDLLFKVSPPVLSPRPDLHFLRLDADKDYTVVMATDGVWDHLASQGSEAAQNRAVLDLVAAAVDAAATTAAGNRLRVGHRAPLELRLSQAASCLAHREAEYEEDDENDGVEDSSPWEESATTSLLPGAGEAVVNGNLGLAGAPVPSAPGIDETDAPGGAVAGAAPPSVAGAALLPQPTPALENSTATTSGGDVGVVHRDSAQVPENGAAELAAAVTADVTAAIATAEATEGSGVGAGAAVVDANAFLPGVPAPTVPGAATESAAETGGSVATAAAPPLADPLATAAPVPFSADGAVSTTDVSAVAAAPAAVASAVAPVEAAAVAPVAATAASALVTVAAGEVWPRLPRAMLHAADGLYARRLPRYDDATAFVVVLTGGRPASAASVPASAPAASAAEA
ncbi:hypothetical protein HK405_007255 [Cladochytrium tenue]|nr:hypothetical protein HK405_007255 [Cladochytrium tenue]